MNWYKESQQVATLGADDQGKLTLKVNGEVREYQLPYTAVGSYSDIANMIQRKQTNKLNKYLQWLEQFRQEYKVAQTYENIMQYPEEYSDGEGDGNLDAHRYFSIGQNETQDDSFCWIWINNQLRVAEGPTTHNVSFRYLTENIGNYYRGWYDPTQKLMSIVVPNSRRLAINTEEDLPSPLRRSLYREFGDDAQMIIF